MNEDINEQQAFRKYGKPAWAATMNGEIALGTIGPTKYHAMALALAHGGSRFDRELTNEALKAEFAKFANKLALIDKISIVVIPIKVTIA